MSHDDLIKFKSNYNAILDLKRKISFAKGHERVDLVVKNAKIVNVFSGEIHQTDVAIADGIFVGFGEEEGYNTKNLYDAQGRFMCPGLIDGHIHIESTFLSPREFCNVVAVHGTSAVICAWSKGY
jgi:adenine deaminase